MNDKEFVEKMKEVLITNKKSEGVVSTKDLFERETGIPYEEFRAMKHAYLSQNKTTIVEALSEHPFHAAQAIFERAFLFGFMLAALDKED